MIDALVTTMVNGFETVLSGLSVDVKEHAGKFTWEELAERRYRCPAVFVSCLGWRELREQEAIKMALPLDGVGYMRARFVAGVVTKGVKKAEIRNVQARLICQLLCSHLDGNDWDNEQVGEAQTIEAEALFAPRAEADNQSMWLVSWWHPLVFSTESIYDELADFLSVHGENYAAPGEHTDAEGEDIPLASIEENLPAPE